MIKKTENESEAEGIESFLKPAKKKRKQRMAKTQKKLAPKKYKTRTPKQKQIVLSFEVSAEYLIAQLLQGLK